MELKDFFKGKKVLVTGHTGFKGGWLCQILLNFGAEVVGVSLAPETKPNLYGILCLDKKVKTYIQDVRHYDKIKDIIKKEKPEILFHLAAQPIVRRSYDNPLETYSTNVIGTANILQAIKECECVKSAVIITTDKVYENKETMRPYTEKDQLGGHDPYSTSKACAEFIITSYNKCFFNNLGISVASARAGNVIGGGDWANDRIITDIVRSIFEKKEPVRIRSPNSIRPWQHVLEPLTGYLLLAKGLYEKKSAFVGAWNFAPEKSNFVPVIDLVKRANSICGGSYLIEPDTKKHEMKLLTLNASKAKKYLGFTPLLKIDEVLKWTFEWYKSFYDGEDMGNLTKNQIDNYLSRLKWK